MYTPSQKMRHVAFLQNALQFLGYPLHANGMYGSKTTEAVRSFQQKNGLPPSGQADRETFQKIMARYQALQQTLRPPVAMQAPRSAFPSTEGLAIGMAQLALLELSRHYSNIQAVALTQRYDDQTRAQMATIRAIWQLPSSDSLDQDTFDGLMRLLAMEH